MIGKFFGEEYGSDFDIFSFFFKSTFSRGKRHKTILSMQIAENEFVGKKYLIFMYDTEKDNILQLFKNFLCLFACGD